MGTSVTVTNAAEIKNELTPNPLYSGPEHIVVRIVPKRFGTEDYDGVWGTLGDLAASAKPVRTLHIVRVPTSANADVYVKKFVEFPALEVLILDAARQLDAKMCGALQAVITQSQSLRTLIITTQLPRDEAEYAGYTGFQDAVNARGRDKAPLTVRIIDAETNMVFSANPSPTEDHYATARRGAQRVLGGVGTLYTP